MKLSTEILIDRTAVQRRAQEMAVEDRWVVGYGLDWNGFYRNLPYISFVDNSLS